MESAIEPSQWREECERVEKQLIYPLKANTGNQEETQLDDFYNRQEQVLGHLKVIKEFTVGPGPVMLDGLTESLKKELKQIKKRETKLNTQNVDQIAIIKVSQERRKTLVQDLKQLANSNQNCMVQTDGIEERLSTVNHKIQEATDRHEQNNTTIPLKK